jgi:hypothetical protein
MLLAMLSECRLKITALVPSRLETVSAPCAPTPTPNEFLNSLQRQSCPAGFPHEA